MPSKLPRLEVRLPVRLRGQLVGLAAADRRSLNRFTVARIEEGLDRYLDRLKRQEARAQDPGPMRQMTMREVEQALIRDRIRPPKPPPMPDNPTDEERAMMGLKPRRQPTQPAAQPAVPQPAAHVQEGLDPEVLAYIQQHGIPRGRYIDDPPGMWGEED